MQISGMGKAVFVCWLLIPVLVIAPGRATGQSSGTAKTIKSASELDYPPFALVRSGGTADGFSVDLRKEVARTMGMPICSHCKKIRDDKGYWNQVEAYIQENSEARFSHGICQECAKLYYPDMDIYGDKN